MVSGVAELVDATPICLIKAGVTVTVNVACRIVPCHRSANKVSNEKN